jgi:molecular chaperone DnaK (HSP70)
VEILINELSFLAIDFGNENLRVAVYCNNQVHVIKNVDNVSRFPQIIISNDRYSAIGTEAENNIIGYSNSFFKDFKKNIIIEPNNENYLSCVTETLLHYKKMSEKYLKKHFENDESIDVIYLTIPIIEDLDENKWKSILHACCIEVGFKKIIPRAEEVIGTSYFMRNYFEKKDWSTQAYCVFNLGSLQFNCSFWRFDNNEYFYHIISKTDGGSYFYPILQNFINNKVRESIEEKHLGNLATLPEYNSKIFYENKKYLAECHKKYRQILETFSGNSKTIKLQFRHLIQEVEIDIEIKKSEIENELELIKNSVLTLIQKTKAFLNEQKVSKEVCFITLGNGIKFPGVLELFMQEFTENFHMRGVFCDEELVRGTFEI